MSETEDAASLVGRTIVAAEWWSVGDGDGDGLKLTLDDGRTVEIEGWGHDWWGTHFSVSP